MGRNSCICEGKTPNENVLESMNKMRQRDSEQLRTIFAFHNQNEVQVGEPASFSRLKNRVKKYLDRQTKDRNFDARNDRAASAAPIRRRGDDRSKSEDRKPEA